MMEPPHTNVAEMVPAQMDFVDAVDTAGATEAADGIRKHRWMA